MLQGSTLILSGDTLHSIRDINYEIDYELLNERIRSSLEVNGLQDGLTAHTH